MSYHGPTKTQHDVVTSARRRTVGNYMGDAVGAYDGRGMGPPYLVAPVLGAYDGRGMGPPYLIAPVLGGLGAVPVGSRWSEMNAGILSVLRPFKDQINGLPISSAQKSLLLSRPLDAVYAMVDVLFNFLVSRINKVIEKGGPERFIVALLQTLDLRIDRPGDSKYDARTLKEVRRLRTIASTIACLTNVLDLPVFLGLENIIGPRGSVNDTVLTSTTPAKIPAGFALYLHSQNGETRSFLENHGWEFREDTQDKRAEKWELLLGVPGTGAPNDPFGGVSGASESKLRAMVRAGVSFFNPDNGVDKFQEGAFNGEKYIYLKGSIVKAPDGPTIKTYFKFKMTGTGIGNTPSDTAAQAWFTRVVTEARVGAVKTPVTCLRRYYAKDSALGDLPTGGAVTGGAIAASGSLVASGTAAALGIGSEAGTASALASAAGAFGVAPEVAVPAAISIEAVAQAVGATVIGAVTGFLKDIAANPASLFGQKSDEDTSSTPPPVTPTFDSANASPPVETSSMSPLVLAGGAAVVIAVALAMSKRK